jgi:hypothetical protein
VTGRTLDLDALWLAYGAHNTPHDGLCVLEAAAYLAGERHSDHPQCVSPVIGAFLRSWNDALDDGDRQTLKQYVPRVVGTASTPEVEDARAWMALDWLVRDYTPRWLRLAGLTEQADRLADLPEFRAGMDVPAIRPVIDAVREDARAAWDAAWAAAWDAVRVAAGDAAGDAVRDAAGDAPGHAARVAARDAARDAARLRLAPTVAECQESAHRLLDRMIEAQS